jgi:hypothetical protein
VRLLSIVIYPRKSIPMACFIRYGGEGKPAGQCFDTGIVSRPVSVPMLLCERTEPTLNLPQIWCFTEHGD